MNSYFMELRIRQSDNIERHTRTENSNEILVHITASALSTSNNDRQRKHVLNICFGDLTDIDRKMRFIFILAYGWNSPSFHVYTKYYRTPLSQMISPKVVGKNFPLTCGFLSFVCRGILQIALMFVVNAISMCRSLLIT